MFITLYGINNIGKTTHTGRLVERLRDEGYDALRVKFPVYDMHPSGDFLNDVLRSGGAQFLSEEELQLWFVLNRTQFEPTLKHWLADGKIVVAEDYTGTGIAWGTTKGVDTAWLESINAHLIKEDVALLLDGERFRAATESGHLHEADDALMMRCREVHLNLGEKYGWHRVPVQDSKDATAALLWDQVAPYLPS